MLELLKELERRVKNLEVITQNVLRIGKVVNRYPEKNTVRVEFERAKNEDKTVSYELPILQPKTLKDKFYYMPEEGEYVLCVFLPYALDVGFVIGSYYNNVIPTPVSDNKKFHLAFEDGTTFEYDKANHKLYIHSVGDIEIISDTHITLKAPRIDLNP